MVDNNYFYTSHVVLGEMNVNSILKVKRNVLLQSFCFSSFLFLLPWLEKESYNKKKMITVLLSTSFQISFIIWCQRATRSLIQSMVFSLPLCLLFISSCLCNRFKRRRKVFGMKEKKGANQTFASTFYFIIFGKTREVEIFLMALGINFSVDLMKLSVSRISE